MNNPIKLSYYHIVPYRKIEESHIWSDNTSIQSWDDEKIILREINYRIDDPCTFVYHRKQEPLIEKIRESYKRDLLTAQKELETFNKEYPEI